MVSTVLCPAMISILLVALACTVPVPSLLGYACTWTGSVPTGSDANVTVEVVPVVGRATVCVATTWLFCRIFTTMLWEAVGIRRDVSSVLGQTMVIVARPVPD